MHVYVLLYNLSQVAEKCGGGGGANGCMYTPGPLSSFNASSQNNILEVAVTIDVL